MKAWDEFLLAQLRQSTQRVNEFIRRMHGFTPAQGQAVHSFLQAINKLHPEYYAHQEPLAAADRYWFRYSL